MVRNGFHKLLEFLVRLEAEHIPYALSHCRTDAIMVAVSAPGERWEIDFGSSTLALGTRTCSQTRFLSFA